MADENYFEPPKKYCNCGHAREFHFGRTWNSVEIPIKCNAVEGCTCIGWKEVNLNGK